MTFLIFVFYGVVFNHLVNLTTLLIFLNIEYYIVRFGVFCWFCIRRTPFASLSRLIYVRNCCGHFIFKISLLHNIIYRQHYVEYLYIGKNFYSRNFIKGPKDICFAGITYSASDNFLQVRTK